MAKWLPGTREPSAQQAAASSSRRQRNASANRRQRFGQSSSHLRDVCVTPDMLHARRKRDAVDCTWGRARDRPPAPLSPRPQRRPTVIDKHIQDIAEKVLDTLAEKVVPLQSSSPPLAMTTDDVCAPHTYVAHGACSWESWVFATLSGSEAHGRPHLTDTSPLAYHESTPHSHKFRSVRVEPYRFFIPKSVAELGTPRLPVPKVDNRGWACTVGRPGERRAEHRAVLPLPGADGVHPRGRLRDGGGYHQPQGPLRLGVLQGKLKRLASVKTRRSLRGHATLPLNSRPPLSECPPPRGP
eukprot:1177709-Prorocentrum_minimum.AAC.2